MTALSVPWPQISTYLHLARLYNDIILDFYSKTTGHNEAAMSNFLKTAVALQRISFIPSYIRVGARGGAVG
jgi:hypothetical protein